MWLRKVRLTSRSICLISDEKLFACSFICWKGAGQTGGSQTPPPARRFPAAGAAAGKRHRATAERPGHRRPATICSLLANPGPWATLVTQGHGDAPTCTRSCSPAFAHLPVQTLSFRNLRPVQLNPTLIPFDFFAVPGLALQKRQDLCGGSKDKTLLQPTRRRTRRVPELLRGSVTIKSKLL